MTEEKHLVLNGYIVTLVGDRHAGTYSAYTPAEAHELAARLRLSARTIERAARTAEAMSTPSATAARHAAVAIAKRDLAESMRAYNRKRQQELLGALKGHDGDGDGDGGGDIKGEACEANGKRCQARQADAEEGPQAQDARDEALWGGAWPWLPTG